ncbi:MAG TPA: hypothetical protein VKB47_11565 [Terracidiphilus sp.]|nr:hypothetical protein [Terracidiphilus sp.]
MNGNNFVSASTVQWNGSNRTTSYVNASQLTASITAADIAATGTVNVTVVNPTPGGGNSAAFNFSTNNPPPPLSTGSMINGILMETYSPQAYDELEYQVLLNNAVDTNANYVGIGGTAAVDLNTGVISDAVVQGYDFSVSMSSISAAIAEAQVKGLNVVLKTIVGAINSSTGQFATLTSTNLAPNQTLANPAAFFANYKTYILQLAQIAQQYHVPLLVLGTEMEMVTQPQYTSYWTDIISSVRQVYSGKLTYGAVSFVWGPTYNEVGNIQFWNQLDYVGVDAYPPVSTGLTTPTVAQIDAAWASQGWKQTLATIATNTGKPVIFTETGSASYLGSLDPTIAYSGSYNLGSALRTQDLATQTNWYQSFMDTWTGPNQPSWFQGALFWNNDPGKEGINFLGGETDMDIAWKPANAIVASIFGGADYLSPLQNTFAGSAENDNIALYGDSVSAGSGGAPPASRQQTYQTTVSLYISASIMNGATPTVHVYINGADYGGHTLANIPGGYVGSNGVPYTNTQRFDFTLSGIVTISTLQVNFDSPVNVGGPENSQLEFQQVSIDGVPITQAIYSPLSQYGGVQEQTVSSVLGGQDNAVQFGGGYTVFDATPYNQQLANLPGSAANPITVNGNGGTDTVHVLGTASQYTESGIGTNSVTLSENSGLNQNATLIGVSYVSFADGSILNLATGQLQAVPSNGKTTHVAVPRLGRHRPPCAAEHNPCSAPTCFPSKIRTRPRGVSLP